MISLAKSIWSLMFRPGCARTFLLGLMCLVGGANAQNIETLVAPGKLSQAHAKWEEDCKQCHVRFDRKAQDGLCQDCHKEVGADMRNKNGFHGKAKPQPCRTCHTEHKGRDTNLVILDTKQFDHATTNYALRGKHEKIECEKCHAAGKKYRVAPQDCLSCHKKDDTHKGNLGPKCASCHTENNWKEAKYDHDTARFALTGKHADIKCGECHKAVANQLMNYRDAPRTCIGCHRKDDEGKKGHKGEYGEKCESCHGTKHWKPPTFNHDSDTKYALRGKHRSILCADCHKGPLYKTKTSNECIACHKKDDKHKDTLGKNCGSCHTEKNWKELVKFDHDKSDFPLLGKHIKTECKECHKSVMFKEAPKDCYSCHKKDDKHKGNLGQKCEECHGEKDWKTTKGKFDHDKTKFKLRNGHAKPAVKCEACHKDLASMRKTPMDCLSCHKKDDKHEAQLGKRCESCHDDKSWKVPKYDHGLTRFPLLGKHAPLECKKCHESLRYKDAKVACVSCHLKEDKHKKTLGPDCGQCHNARDWKDWRFDHDKRTKYVLDGKHKGVACTACHLTPTDGKVVTSTLCISCHTKDDVHEGKFGRMCQQCHVTSSFKEIRQQTGRPMSLSGIVPTWSVGQIEVSLAAMHPRVEP